MTFPSDEQENVIRHHGKPLMVVAAPGTGKTSTIVERMINLLKENPDREISFITFTRSSRRDTSAKIVNKLGEAALTSAEGYFPRVSTLYTYAKSLVHKHAKLIGRDSDFSILVEDSGELKILLSELIQDLELDINSRQLGDEISAYRCTSSWPDGGLIPSERSNEVMARFEFLLKFYNTYDLEGLIPASCDILSTLGEDLPQVYLHVDEYQDLNPVDQRFISMLCNHEESEVVVVGDDAQSIYGFRFANPDDIRSIGNSEQWETIILSECHRMPSHVLRAAHSLISEGEYLGSRVNIPEDDGKKIQVFQCTRDDYQIHIVAKTILEELERGSTSEKKLSYNDFMILCPTGSQVERVSALLRDSFSIPTRRVEKKNIPEDHWRLMLVLRMLNYNDSLALRQWLAIQGINESDILNMRNEAIQSGVSFFEYCSSLEDPKVKAIFTNLNLLRTNNNDLEKFKALLLEFPNLLIDNTLFPEVGMTIIEATGESFSISSIIQHVYEKFGLIDRDGSISEEDSTLVTTMHSAKGLESEIVIIMWLSDRYLPLQGRDPEEELRVLYVALTRAKKDVILTFEERWESTGYLSGQAISPFLSTISSHLNVRRIRKADL